MARRVPRGRVASYGQIAALCGFPRGARLVGWALHGCPPEILMTVPWQRIINQEGRISTTCHDHTQNLQKFLLEKEGVEVTEAGGNFFVNMDRFQWKPRTIKPLLKI